MAKHRDVREILIGAVTVAALAVLMVYLYGGRDVASASVDHGIVLSAKFNRIDGLVEGSDVYLSGIQIGKVEKMWLDENFRAEVRMRVNQSVPIPTDSAAAIHTDGLFGTKYVVIQPGGEYDAMKTGDTFTFTQDAVVVSDLLELIISEGKANREEQRAK